MDILISYESEYRLTIIPLSAELPTIVPQGKPRDLPLTQKLIVKVFLPKLNNYLSVI